MINIPPDTSGFGNDHVHTWRSDGELTELEVILYALTKNLGRIELTDHDTVMAWSPQVVEEINQYVCGEVTLFSDGRVSPPNERLIRPEYVQHILTEGGFDKYTLHSYHKIQDAARGVLKCGDLRIGKGVELTADMGWTFHILGLLLEDIDDALRERLDKICRLRRERARAIIERLYGDDYFFGRTLEWLQTKDPSFSQQQLQDLICNKRPISYEDVIEINPNSPSRLTIGFLLWKRYGPNVYWELDPEGNKRPLRPIQVRDIYLDRRFKDIPKVPTVSPKVAIEEIQRNNGIPALAHPNEGRDAPETDEWLEGDFGVLESMGYDVGKLLETDVVTEEDIRWAANQGIMALFCKWGIRGIEKGPYVNKHANLVIDLSSSTDYHGPNLKPTRQISGGPTISTESLLNVNQMSYAHNALYWKMRAKDAPQYEEWRQSWENTQRIIESFPPPQERTDEQQKIVDSIPKELRQILTLEEYLDMTQVYEINPPYFLGTVLEMDKSVQKQLRQIVDTGSYITDTDDRFNRRMDAYLRGRLEKHTRLEILLQNLPFLHNIGKVLTFGVDEVQGGNKQARYHTTFVQHDLVGAELIESIRTVLAEQQGLTDREIDYIREITRYHVGVHKTIYKAMKWLADGLDINRIGNRIVEDYDLNPESILDSLLLIKAAGKMSYSKDLDQYTHYTHAIDELMKICVDRLPQ